MVGALSPLGIAASLPSELVVEEVLVTAQKREQSLQDIPLSVTVFGGEDLQNAGVSDLQSLEIIEPTLVIRSSTDESRGASIRIRGVGTSGNNTGLEGSVGVFLDGVYLSRAGIAMNDLIDIEKVEVLRGPQGTLFGKNTSSGAIVINTQKPEFETGGALRVSYGNYRARVASGTVTGALVEDSLAGRLTFSANYRDGQVKDVNTRREYNDRDRRTARGQLLFTPSESLDVRVIADVGKKDERCCASPYSEYGPRQSNIEQTGGTTVSRDPFDREIAIDGDHTNSTDEYGLSSEIAWHRDAITLTSISSFRNYKYDIETDGDRSDVDIVNTFLDADIDTATQEFRVQGIGSMVDWLAGIYLFSERVSDDSQTLYGADTGDFFASFVANPNAKATIRNSYVQGDGATVNEFSQKARGWSVFTHNRFVMSENFDFDFGLRYNKERKEGAGRFESRSTSLCNQAGGLRALAILCPVPDFDTRVDYEAVTGTLKASYVLQEGKRIYAGYSRGFKAGGVNLNRSAGLSNFEFDPEIADSVEIGGKFSLFDRRVRLNFAAYLSEFKDFQLNTFDGVTTVVSNEAGVESEGFEVDLTAAVAPGIYVMAGGAYNDSHYTRDTVDPSLAGRQISNAPKVTLTTGMSYLRPLIGTTLNLFGDANVRYQEGVNTGSDLDDQKYQPDFVVVNMRLGVEAQDGQWRTSVWGRNVFDEEYFAVVIDAPGQAGSYQAFLAQPATYGVTAEFVF